nr:hypothetical protein [uncultured Blautia sp.]
MLLILRKNCMETIQFTGKPSVILANYNSNEGFRREESGVKT